MPINLTFLYLALLEYSSHNKNTFPERSFNEEYIMQRKSSLPVGCNIWEVKH